MKKILSLVLVLAMLSMLLCSCALGEKIKVTRGQTAGNVYNNESIDVTFTAPDGWTFYTDDQIAELMGASAEFYKDKDALESAEITTVMDFYAIGKTSNNVSLSIENLATSGNANMSVEEYKEISKKNVQEQVVGMEVSYGAESKISLGGNEYIKLELTTTYLGIEMAQYQYLRKISNYITVISVTIVDGTDIADIEKQFS